MSKQQAALIQGSSRYHPLRIGRFALGNLLAILCLSSCLPTYPHPSLPTGEALEPLYDTLEPIPTLTPGGNQTLETAQLEIVSFPKGPVSRYGMLELEILTGLAVENPFNLDEVNIRVEFTSASGKAVDVGAFWYQEFDYASRKFIGNPCWKARFSPTETGLWTAVAKIPQLGMISSPVRFEVIESGEAGFVRINTENRRYFEFDNGDFFFPIGMNMAWWSGAGDALHDYEKWMDLLAANGGNTIRVWMAEWSFGIEWNNTPLGDYGNRLQRAWLLDQIFAMAEERDIYIILVLLNCADFNNWQTKGWDGNPYNAARGGPLETPAEFVTDPTARALLQRKLNYIVNRWGYSPNLLAWEWWNEVNLAPFTDETLVPWLQEMTAYLDQLDINQHLVTNSYAIRDLSPIWDLPELDIIQKHEYALQVDSDIRDIAERASADFERLAESAPVKPILLGEFGYGNEGYNKDLDKSGIHLHNGLWATTFAGYAGSGMYWYWDVYVEQYQSWHHFRGLERFLAGLDLSGYEPVTPLQITGPNGQPGEAFGMGLRGEDILIWLRSDAYTVQACEESWAKAGNPENFSCPQPSLDNQILTLQGEDSGEYIINWYDPQRGAWLDPFQITAERGSLAIAIPKFRKDLAARISLSNK